MYDWKSLKPVFDQRLQRYTERYGSEVGQPSFKANWPTEEMQSEAHNPTEAGVPIGLLRKTNGWFLSLLVLRRFPRYLLLFTFLSGFNRIDPGHYEYWRCTGAYASQALNTPLLNPIDKTQANESPTQQHTPTTYSADLPLDSSDLHELCLLIQTGLLGNVESFIYQLDFQSGEDMFEDRFNPTIRRLVSHSFQLSTRYGFPVLERLTKRMAPRGKRLQKNIRYWINRTKNVGTKKTLIEFKRMGQIDPEQSIITQLDNLVDDDGLDDLEWGTGLIRDLQEEYRGPSQHGRKTFSGLSITIITLSCLVFWDSIDEDTFILLRRQLKSGGADELGFQKRALQRGRWNPGDFYHPSMSGWGTW